MLIYAEGHDPATTSEHWFYNHTERLVFDKKTWTYYRVMADGRQPLNGVTKVAHIIDRSEALVPWAVKKAMEKLKRLLLETTHPDCDGNVFISLFEAELDKIIQSAKKADEEELEAAGQTGTVAHDWIESYIQAILTGNQERRLELLSKFPVDERAANACFAALEWMSAHNVRWSGTERRVFSREHGYAGTLDGLAIVDSCGNPSCCPHEFKDRLTLVDWKTSNYLYIEFLLQTAAYQHAYQEESGELIEDRWILRLDKWNADFDPWHMEGQALFKEDFSGFLHALDLTRSVKQLNARVSDIKEARATIQKAAERALRDAEYRIRCPKADVYKGVRKSTCFPDGSQCEACKRKYEECPKDTGPPVVDLEGTC